MFQGPSHGSGNPSLEKIMEGEMEDQERIAMMRRAARKLASNKSKNRVVRKLPRTIEVVRVHKRALHLRTAINSNKRLAYILLLGAVMCAYVYDLDQNTLENMIQSVSQAATHLPFLRSI